MADRAEADGILPRTPILQVLAEGAARVSAARARAGAGEADGRARGHDGSSGEAVATPGAER